MVTSTDHQHHRDVDRHMYMSTVSDLITLDEYLYIRDRIKEYYGLKIVTVKSYAYNIKSVMARENFTFTEGLSNATKAYQLLHVVGHYHFMTSARRKNVTRYDYIFSSFKNASLLIYEEAAKRASALNLPLQDEDVYAIPPEIRANRIAFEAGANKYADLILGYLGMQQISPLLKRYEPADIQYLLDITSQGRRAIVCSDSRYITKYVDAAPKLEEVPDIEGVYDTESFRIGDIDWKYLERLQLEFHFF